VSEGTHWIAVPLQREQFSRNRTFARKLQESSAFPRAVWPRPSAAVSALNHLVSWREPHLAQANRRV